MPHRRRLLIGLSAVLLSACAGIEKKDKAARLKDTLNAYSAAIRWGNYDTAAAFAVPRDGSTVTVDRSVLAGLKVTGYEVRVASVNEDGSEARANMRFTYYQESRGTIRTAIQDATWYFDDERGQWLMDDGLPAFRL